MRPLGRGWCVSLHFNIIMFDTRSMYRYCWEEHSKGDRDNIIVYR